MTTITTQRNYVYHVRDVESDIIDDAIYAAHRYRNKLCELERAKRDRHQQLLQRLVPDYVRLSHAAESLDTRIGDLYERFAAEKARQGKKRPKGVDDITAEITALKAQRRETYAELKAAKQAAYERDDVQQAMAANQAVWKRERKIAKDESGLYWGTEAVVAASCKSFSSGAPPRFTRYTGEGQLAVQFQGGRHTGELNGGEPNTLCYLDDIDANHAYAYFRVASDNGRPVFARCKVAFHRPLPAGAAKWCYLERRKRANHDRWALRFTVESRETIERDKSTWVAVHFGWVMQSSGLRVATWKGCDGRSGAVVLPLSHIDADEETYEIRSERDREFNERRAEMLAWCEGKTLPEWLAERMKHAAKWKSPRRMASLIVEWRTNRFRGDAAIYETMETWRKWDKHRWQHETRVKLRAVGRRNDMYRCFAKRLAEEYGVLYYCAIQKAKLVRKPAADQDDGPDATTHRRRAQQAATSTLQRYLLERFPLHAIAVDSTNLTKECSRCGAVCDTQHKRDLLCTSCGRIDVDENAIANTIARGQVAQEEGALLELVSAERDKADALAARLKKMQAANRAARKRQLEAKGDTVLR